MKGWMSFKPDAQRSEFPLMWFCDLSSLPEHVSPQFVLLNKEQLKKRRNSCAKNGRLTT
jgi:hypothetical protein